MPCVSPQTIVTHVVNGGSTATVTLTHCDDSAYLYLEVEFRPRNIGAAVDVQGYIWTKGQAGKRQATKAVRFFDDGTLVGYGDQTYGVRFLQRETRPHSAHLSAVAVP